LEDASFSLKLASSLQTSIPQLELTIWFHTFVMTWLGFVPQLYALLESAFDAITSSSWDEIQNNKKEN